MLYTWVPQFTCVHKTGIIELFVGLYENKILREILNQLVATYQS